MNEKFDSNKINQAIHEFYTIKNSIETKVSNISTTNFYGTEVMEKNKNIHNSIMDLIGFNKELMLAEAKVIDALDEIGFSGETKETLALFAARKDLEKRIEDLIKEKQVTMDSNVASLTKLGTFATNNKTNSSTSQEKNSICTLM
jgi:hypothetical protein